MKLQKDKTQIVEFQIEIEGTQDKITPRLVLKGRDMSIVFDGKMKGKNAIFEVSKLDRFFENAKEADAEIEVIVENKYFTPWKSTVEFEVPVKVTVTESLQPMIKEPIVKIEAKPTKVTKPTIREGQRKIKINGKLVEVLITKVFSTETGKTVLKILDENGESKIVRVK